MKGLGGLCQVDGHKCRSLAQGASGDGDLAPSGECLGPEGAERSAGDEMALGVAVVVDGGMGGEKPLCRPGRSEPEMLAFTATGWLVRDLCPIVRTPAGDMAVSSAKIPQGCTVGSEPIRDDGVRQVSLALEELPHKLERRLLVASRLNEDIENLTRVVDGAPEIMDPAADPDEHLIEVPPPRRAWTTLPEPRRIDASELERPLPNRLIRDVDAALGAQVLDVAIAEREAELEPHGMPDDLGGEAVPGI